MFQLIESIRLEAGTFLRLPYHQQRMDTSMRQLNGVKNRINLARQLEAADFPTEGLFKCRVLYANRVTSIEFIPYPSKKLENLKLVSGQQVTYAHKFADRAGLEMLFEKRENCDEILIVKNGLITDSSYSNIIFFDGSRWVTPASPLLRGTMRQFLLDTGKIREEELTPADLPRFKKCRLINAMTGFDGPEIDVSRIVP
jgi:4-amino-4-deoxychorismate lyase